MYFFTIYFIIYLFYYIFCYLLKTNHAEIVCHICRPQYLLIQEVLVLSVLMCVCVCACSVISDSMQSHGLQHTRFLCPWNFPGKNTGLGCCSLLQGIFSTPRSNPHLLRSLHYQADSLPLCDLGRPLVLKVHLNESIANERQEFKVNSEESLFLNPEE